MHKASLFLDGINQSTILNKGSILNSFLLRAGFFTARHDNASAVLGVVIICPPARLFVRHTRDMHEIHVETV